MKKFLRILPLAVVLVAGCGTTKPTQFQKPTAATAPVIEQKIYTNASGGFSITYTNDWKYIENLYGALVSFFAPQTKGSLFRENLSLAVVKLPAAMTVDQYYATTKKQLLKMIKDFKEDSNEATTVATLPAKKIVYEGTQQTYNLKWQQVFFIKDKKIYTLTYTAPAKTFDALLPQVTKMIESLTIK